MAQSWWQKAGYSSDPTISSPLRGPNINFTPVSGVGVRNVTPTTTPSKQTGTVLGTSNASSIVTKPVTANTSDTDSFYEKQKKQMEDEKAKREKQAKEIGRSFDPIFTELSRQLSMLPQKEAEYKGQVEAGEVEGKNQIETSKQKATQVLEKEKGSSLRNLEEDVRNQQESAGRKIGLLGAGSSSSVDQASEAVMRIGQKTRGSLLEAHEAKLADVEAVASNNLAELNTWKREKLFEVTDIFRKEMNRLLEQKADATSSKKRAVESLIYDLEKEYSQSLRQLDQQVMGYKQQVEAWKMQEASNVQKRNQGFDKVASDAKAYQQALGTFNDLVSSGNVSRGQAQQEVLKAFGILIPVDDTKKDEFDVNSNYDVITDATGVPYYVDMNNTKASPQPVFAEETTPDSGSDFGDRFLQGLRGLID